MRWSLWLIILLVGCSSPTAPTPLPVTPIAQPPSPVPTNPLLTDARFDRGFYRQFTHDLFEATTPVPLARWTRAPLIYLRTIDETGAAVSPALLDQTAAAVINTTPQWTGGAFGVAGLEQGTATHAGDSGWLTILWRTTGACGVTSIVGHEGTTITLNHRRPECTCGPLTVKHELGHALGFWHTDRTDDLMTPLFPAGQCDKPLSAREQFHAQVAYSLPVGSLDP